MKIFKILLLSYIILTFLTSESIAEESTYMVDSPAVYAIAGLLIVDVGASLSNGFSLINNRPNRVNGYFGIVTGAISLGLVTINLLVEEDDDLRNDFALVMGTAGAASLVLGIMNVRNSGSIEEIPVDESGITIYPAIIRESDQKYNIGLNMNISF